MSDLASRLSGLDAYIEAEMQKWHIPGLAVAVIHDGEVIHQQGYGVRDLDNPQPVTPDTLFAIASCSKAFTAMDLALLVEAGKLDWDKPVRHYMPQFRMYDPIATEYTTARDLVGHRTGLPRHDAVWYGTSAKRWELFEGLQYLKPSYPFRMMYQYQNLMYMAAGCLIETISGQTWEQFTQERIFNVFGMNNSLFSVTTADKAANAAKPHEIKNGAARRVPFCNLDAIAPAGAIHSNLTNMMPWLRMHMNGGLHEGQPFIPADSLKHMHQAHVVAPLPPLMAFPEIQQTTYGLGWSQSVYRGHLRIRHTGGIDGFITDFSFMPQDKIGILVFNNGGDALSHSVALHIYDLLLGSEQEDWRERWKAAENKMEADAKEMHEKLRGTREPNTTPSHPLADYVAEYTHPGYGTLTVSLHDGALQAKYNNLVLHLVHLHYDVFETLHDQDYESRAPMPITFSLDIEGNIAQAAIQLEPEVEAIVFARK
jgi:CubicO group peptidase (beta-lactamase class C family)